MVRGALALVQCEVVTPDKYALRHRSALELVHGGRERAAAGRSAAHAVSGFLERVLGQASFRLYQLARRWQRRRLFEAFSAARRHPVPRWYALTEWLTRSSANGALMALVSPRWNCHAVLALTEFFQVRRKIAVRCAEAEGSAVYWSLVVYDARFQPVEQLGNASGRRGPASRLKEVILPPGRYMLRLRYYEAPQRVVFPEVWVDGQPLIGAELACEEARRYQQYLSGLRQNRTLSELFLHFHAYAFLKHRERHDAAWLRARYLLADSAETAAVFGALEKGQVLRVSPSRLAGGETYVTIYDRASRPLCWERVTEPVELESPAAGTYLVRHVSRAGAVVPADLEVQVTPCAGAAGCSSLRARASSP